MAAEGLSPDTQLLDVQNAIARSGVDWVAGETSVSQLSDEEFGKMLGGIIPPENSTPAVPETSGPGVEATLPPNLNWRTYNGGDYTTPIKSQGSCGSCWAFGTIATFESKIEISAGLPALNPNLSEQDLVSCSGAGNCGGGRQDLALNYLQAKGTVDETCFPYRASNLPCSGCKPPTDPSRYKIQSYVKVPVSETAIKQALMRGPVVALYKVYSDFENYRSGVYKHVSGSYRGNHVVSLVGYGTDAGGTYWIAKNSWGTGWGEAGWFKIRAGDCGINEWVYEMTVVAKVPAAQFVATPTTGNAPLTVQFNDRSTNAPTSWTWNFGDGSVKGSGQNPVHRYTRGGKYTVTMTTGNVWGSDTEQKVNYIEISIPMINGWSYRKEHKITGSANNAVVNYQIPFEVRRTTGTDNRNVVFLGSKVKPDYSDLLITTTTNKNLSYWIQSSNASSAVIWVNVTSIPTTGTDVFIYYGNPAATAKSNGKKTFPFFDHFKGEVLDTSRWGSTGDIEVGGSMVTLDQPGEALNSVPSFGKNTAFISGTQLVPSAQGYIGYGSATYFTGFSANHPVAGEVNAVNMVNSAISSTPVGVTTEWNTMEVARGNSINRFSINGIIKAGLGNNRVLGNQKISSSATGLGQSIRIDYIAVRNFRQTEPGHGTWNPEERA
ncbi:MAG: DUF2341 domain-containing protein [Methanoregulaceae archaeon]|nr:DUF2341 domain-containing protein [Methanoregulaceae archaeon]